MSAATESITYGDDCYRTLPSGGCCWLGCIIRPTFLVPEEAPICESKDLLTLQVLHHSKCSIRWAPQHECYLECILKPKSPAFGQYIIDADLEPKSNTICEYGTFDDSSASSTTPATSPPGVCGLETRNLGKWVPDLTCDAHLGFILFVMIIWTISQGWPHRISAGHSIGPAVLQLLPSSPEG